MGATIRIALTTVASVVFDIETVGVEWESLDDAQRTYLQRNARTEEERARLPELLSLWPFTGRIVVLAMLNPDTGRGRVWYEKTDGRVEEASEDGLFTFVGDTETVFLGEFWNAIARFHRFVTFNGRGFDGPFLMIRSAALGIPVTKNLVGYRYAVRPHTDLLDVLTFFGASRKWNLDFACKAFGIESPKEQGMDGYSVGPYYRTGRLREIALYCRRDVEATARLFQKLEKTLLPALEDTRL
jgi:3'-5' exonuclease